MEGGAIMGTYERLCGFLEDKTGLYVCIKSINSAYIGLEFRNNITNEHVMYFFVYRETATKRYYDSILAAVLYKLNNYTEYKRKNG